MEDVTAGHSLGARLELHRRGCPHRPARVLGRLSRSSGSNLTSPLPRSSEGPLPTSRGRRLPTSSTCTRVQTVMPRFEKQPLASDRDSEGVKTHFPWIGWRSDPRELAPTGAVLHEVFSPIGGGQFSSFRRSRRASGPAASPHRADRRASSARPGDAPVSEGGVLLGFRAPSCHRRPQAPWPLT